MVAPQARQDRQDRPRGRKSAEHARATRSAIVQLAGELFAERGYIETSIRDISRHASVTTGAIYGHFRGKAELLAEAIRLGFRPSCSEVILCKPPNSTLEAVSEPVSATPSQPSMVPKNG